MTEKWMQSKPNPYMNNVQNGKVRVRKHLSTYGKQVAAHYGMPIQLFKDSDKDKVDNVFDCAPHNKKKQDVIMPKNFGGGLSDMYARQEAARQYKEYERMVKELAKQDQERLEAFQKSQQVTKTSSRIGREPISEGQNREQLIKDIRGGKVEGWKIEGGRIMTNEGVIGVPDVKGTGANITQRHSSSGTGRGGSQSWQKSTPIIKDTGRGGSQSWQKTTKIL